MERELNKIQSVYVELTKQLEFARIAELAIAPAYSTISPPRIQMKRAWPNRRLTLIAGMAISLLISLFVVFIISFIRQNQTTLARLLHDDT